MDTKVKIISMDEIQAEEIKWLWKPYIPFGKLTIVQGDPGEGKTTFVLRLAAQLSQGKGFDESMEISEPMNVIYQTAEDGLADTVKPRLLSANADCSKIKVIDRSSASVFGRSSGYEPRTRSARNDKQAKYYGREDGLCSDFGRQSSK